MFYWIFIAIWWLIGFINCILWLRQISNITIVELSFMFIWAFAGPFVFILRWFIKFIDWLDDNDCLDIVIIKKKGP